MIIINKKHGINLFNLNYFFVILFLTLCTCGNIFGRISDILKVKLPHGGTLIGRYLTSHNGRGIRAFMGIPYALPPLGELRFEAPIPAPSWKGEKFALEDSSICIQRDPFRRDLQIEGSEDCLYLNVYTPQDIVEPLPVMVFFHGGGWECGSGVSSFYGPDFLMDYDVVYVSGNFRLGPLGFLSTETQDCPGNNGLKDQVEILKWIQQNIAAFGGDPNKVTIFGESAGGASGTYHMMSPLSIGLFHQVISQSGTYFNPWAQPAHKGVASARAKKLANLMGCNIKDSWKNILKCLKTKPATNITASVYDFFEWDYDPMIPFPPTVEPPNTPGAFITTHPRNVKSPHGMELAWMGGVTTEEGALKTAPLLNIPGLLEDFKANFDRALPISLNYDHQPENVRQQITTQISEFYFKGKHDWSKENHQNLTNLYTDAWFLSGFDEYLRLRLHDATSSSTASDEKHKEGRVGPTYVYLFDHKGEASFTEIFNGGINDFYGVCHADELQYLFPIAEHLLVTAVPTERDILIRNALLKLWVNFVKFGNPTPPSAIKELTKWTPATSYPVRYLKIGSQDDNNWTLFSEEKGLFNERVTFWHELKAHLPVTNVKDEL